MELGTPWPWLRIENHPLGFNISIIMFQSWQWVIGAVGLAAYYLYERLCQVDPQPMKKWERYAVRASLAVLVACPILLGTLHMALGSRQMKKPAPAAPAATEEKRTTARAVPHAIAGAEARDLRSRPHGAASSMQYRC